MRLLKSHYLNDGKLFNDGRPVDLIQIESEDDFDTILNNIISSNYYDGSYFNQHIDYREGRVKFDAFYLASIIKSLKPKSVLELGCGRGDVLFLLGSDNKIAVRGIEFSQDVLTMSWPTLTGKVDCGDVLEVCRKFHSQKTSFDTLCAFDLWEHLLPRRLHDYIGGLVALAEKDALFFFTIPAFGEDKVFGEIFPLELEENREKFNQRLPFNYLNAESSDPAIPAQGHLIWAHSDWWQKQFEQHGLVRVERLEQLVHQYFDEHLFYARKSFYIFHLDTPQARRRVNRLKKGLTLFGKWNLLVGLQESIGSFIKNQEKSFIDLGELKLTIHHAEFYMIQDLKKRIEWWTGKLHPKARTGVGDQPLPSLLDKLAFKCLDAYIRLSRKRHYRFH
jgi:SAM-dependent methyltransferase